MPGSWPERQASARSSARCGTAGLARRRRWPAGDLRDGSMAFGDDVTELAFHVPEVASLNRRAIRKTVIEAGFSAARMADGYEALYRRILGEEGADEDAAVASAATGVNRGDARRRAAGSSRWRSNVGPISEGRLWPSRPRGRRPAPALPSAWRCRSCRSNTTASRRLCLTVALTFRPRCVLRFRPPRRSVVKFSHGEFGPRVGARGSSRLLERRDPGNLVHPGHTLETFPESTAAILAGGHELACHGWYHEDFSELSTDEQPRESRRSGRGRGTDRRHANRPVGERRLGGSGRGRS